MTAVDDDPWTREMHRRGLVDENGWFKHRLWKVPPVFAPKTRKENDDGDKVVG